MTSTPCVLLAEAARRVQALRVEGHTDDQGSDTYNERLSLRRAQAVAQALAEAGMERGHISVRG